MGIAATPRYMNDNALGFYDALSPAAKFYTFFPIWNNDWSMDDKAKDQALKKILAYSPAAKAQTQALLDRQSCLIKTINDQHKLTIHTKSISPFMTGTGMEHPLENGFAFLQPYGLPYLAGSGVKGTLRQTARLLAQDAFGEGTFGWNPSTIEVLFGTDPQKDNIEPEHCLRGALTFWDVIVSPKVELTGGQESQSMKIDILTPHQSQYLQGSENPHDSGDPIPVPFLCIGAGAHFNFHITANPHLLDKSGLSNHWQNLLTKCFEFTADWFGFGAKTAVGYGVLKIDTAALEKQQAAQAEAQKTEQQKDMSALEKAMSDLKTALESRSDWKGKPNVDPGFLEIYKLALASDDTAQINQAIIFLTENGKEWQSKPLSKNDNWKKRLNDLRAKTGA